MRLTPSLRSSQLWVRASFAVASTVALAVVAACSDTAGKSITAPQQARSAVIGSGGFGQAKVLTLCVTGPSGDYTFRNDELNRSVALDGSNMALSGNGVWDGSFWNDPGDGGTGTTAPNALEDVPYTVAAGGCVAVLTRTSGDVDFMAKLPIAQGGTCNPATTTCGGENDAFAAATVLYLSNNAGAVYDHTDCTLDDGVLMPEHINPTTGNPPVAIIPWPTGGFDHLNPPTYTCGSTNNPTRGFVNFEHGATITFVFTPAEGNNCTFTQGYYKTHESYTASVLSGNTGTTYIDGSGKLLIGAYALSAAQVDDILETPVGKGYNSGGVVFTKDQLGMIHQLITAELNIAGGAAPAAVSAIITAANANYTTASKSQLSSWTSALDAFNNGFTGPGHC